MGRGLGGGMPRPGGVAPLAMWRPLIISRIHLAPRSVLWVCQNDAPVSIGTFSMQSCMASSSGSVEEGGGRGGAREGGRVGDEGEEGGKGVGASSPPEEGARPP